MVVRPKTIAFAIHGPICRDDLPGLCDRVCATLGAETSLTSQRSASPGRRGPLSRNQGASTDAWPNTRLAIQAPDAIESARRRGV